MPFSKSDFYGFVPPVGLIAGVLLLSQGILGIVMLRQKDKERRKKVASVHRKLGNTIIAAVLVHRIVGYLTK